MPYITDEEYEKYDRESNYPKCKNCGARMQPSGMADFRYSSSGTQWYECKNCGYSFQGWPTTTG